MSNLKILIIDDETDYCLLMKNYFSKKNYEVHVAHTLTDGLQMIENIGPDILFLDNNLPDGKGWDSVPKIVEKNPHLRAYLASAYYKGENIFSEFPQVVVWQKPLSMKMLQDIF